MRKTVHALMFFAVLDRTQNFAEMGFKGLVVGIVFPERLHFVRLNVICNVELLAIIIV
jgi:hypothetical protein